MFSFAFKFFLVSLLACLIVNLVAYIMEKRYHKKVEENAKEIIDKSNEETEEKDV